ncbi:hypothetical protein J2R98_002801 [Alkalibacillus filiformis]|uniref:Uncharacterized protein n=1 Tax=Alkalibacillus filiformis TaxID=200990 RepID=A0ABU0DWZ3_9BACI|nr:hypothetical protein [Alkalibacillus filiformis]
MKLNPAGFYWRSGKFIGAQENLLALRKIYWRSGKFIGAQENLLALTEIDQRTIITFYIQQRQKELSYFY